MANLFQLGTEYLQIEQILIENGGELTEELETLLDQNKEAVQVKFVSLGFVTRSMVLNQTIIDAEIERLSKLKKTYKNAEDRLKGYIKSNMERLGLTEVKGDLMTVSIRQNPFSVHIDDETKLPKKFITKKVTETPDKKAIKLAIDAGQRVKGAELRRTTALVIK